MGSLFFLRIKSVSNAMLSSIGRLPLGIIANARSTPSVAIYFDSICHTSLEAPFKINFSDHYRMDGDTVVDWLTPMSFKVEEELDHYTGSDTHTICVYKDLKSNSRTVTKAFLVDLVFHKYMGKLTKNALRKRNKQDLLKLLV